ncbi:hypothetical protein LCGC14_1177000 [marine sediment metagenome]|uniref:Uncharacterized protein n=1 Tax=marine sediment metagenome TaxID=412755 RepID=A0A0F9LNB4_9ZZZZ
MWSIEKKKAEKEFIETLNIKNYFIHVEFELENVLTQLQLNKKLMKVIVEHGYDTYTYITSIKICLSRIKQLIMIS